MLVLLPLCLASLWAQAQQGGDLQAQILYAFYIEDGNQLSSLVQLLSTQQQANGADNALRYHLAHAQYRLGLLGIPERSPTADDALAGCINELKPVLEGAADNVEALALQSACYAGLARLRKVEAVLLRTHADDRIERAAQLAPHNPRVELLRAQETLSRTRSGTARPGTAVGVQAFGQLQLAAQVFEQSSTTSVDAPSWGHAETYLELGRQSQSNGDVIDARNWIEKALILAPDFKAAQRQLKSLTQR